MALPAAVAALIETLQPFLKCQTVDDLVAVAVSVRNEPDAVLEQTQALAAIDLELLSKMNDVLIVAKEVAKLKDKDNQLLNLLSLEHLRSIYTALEMVWMWALSPWYTETINYSCKDKSPPKSLMMKVFPTEVSPSLSAEQVWQLALCFYEINSHELFRATMLPRNLDRVMLSLLVFSSDHLKRDKWSSEVSTESKATIQNLVQSPIKALVVESLRSFTDSPSWLRKESLAVFTSVILQPEDGLEAVLSGYLDGMTAGVSVNPLQVQVAKLVTAPPSFMDKQEYLSLIAPQLNKLIVYASRKNDGLLMKVCVMIVARIAHLSPSLCDKYVLALLSEPLLAVDRSYATNEMLSFPLYSYNKESKTSSTSSNNAVKGKFVQTEYTKEVIVGCETIEETVNVLHSLLMSCPITSPIINTLERSGAAKAIFRLCFFLRSTSKECHMNSKIEEFIKNFLQNASVKVSVNLLEYLIFEDSPNLFSFQNTSVSLCTVQIVKRGDTSVTEHLLLPKQRESASAVKMPFEIGRDEEMSDENAILAALDELSQSVLHGNQCSNDLMFDNYPVLGELGRITLYGRITCEVILAIHKLNGDELSSINAKDSVKNDFKSNEKVKAKEENAVNEIGIGAKIASELFMRCIKCYLVVNESLSESVKGQWSVLLMIVQANLPVDVLLTNGLQIFTLLQSLILNYCAALDNQSFQQVKQKNPIIIEIDSTNTDEFSHCHDQAYSCRELGLDISQQTDSSLSNKEYDLQDESNMVNVLNLLDTIIIAGKQKRTDEEEVAIKEMLPFLQKIAFHDSNNNLSQTAYNICVNILNRNAIQGSGLSVDSPHQIGGQTLEDVIEFTDKSYLTGDSPAMKAFGLRQLSNFISKSKSESTLSDVEILQALSIFVRELSDHDSYVYFNCLVGVSALAERNRDVTLNLLLDLFSGRKSVGDRVDLLNTKDNLEYYDKYLTNLSVRQRAILGESIVRIVKKSGKVLNRNLLAKVISSAIGIARQKSNTEHAQIINSGVDLLRMRVKKENFQFSSPELEGVDIELRNVNQSLLVATTEAADLVLLRQSALSILSEALVTIDWGAAKYLRDILDICVGILTLESGYNEASRACRRSAIFVERHILKALKSHLLTMESGGEYLKMLYRSIKLMTDDKDEIVQYHANSALADLDQFMRGQLFFTKEQLRGDNMTSIRILR